MNMDRKSVLRRSQGKKKYKNVKEDSLITRTSPSNVLLALSQASVALAENKQLKQKEEYWRARSSYNGNDFRFPPQPDVVSIGTQTQMQSEPTELDHIICEKKLFEREVEIMRGRIQDLEEQLRYARCEGEEKLSSLKQLIKHLGRREKLLIEELNDLKLEMKNLLSRISLPKSSSGKVTKVNKVPGHGFMTSGFDHGDCKERLENGYLPNNIERNAVNTTEREVGGRHDSGYGTSDFSAGKNSVPEVRYRTELRELKELVLACREEGRCKLEGIESLLASELRFRHRSEQPVDTIPDKPEVLKMPHDIREFSWKLQSYMVTTDKVGHFFRALGVNCPDVEELTSREGVSPRDQFWSLLCFWFKESCCRATVDDLQQTCIDVDIGILKNGCMPKEHRRILEKVYSFLEENLLPAVTLPYMRDKGLLDNSDVFHVTSQRTRRERCSSLLNLLPLFGEQALEDFCEALVKSDQPHLEQKIRDYQSKSDEKENTEPKHHGISADRKTESRGQKSTSSCHCENEFGIPQNRDILMRILASIWTSSNHVEAMVMNMSGGSNSSSLARSDDWSLVNQNIYSSSLARSDRFDTMS